MPCGMEFTEVGRMYGYSNKMFYEHADDVSICPSILQHGIIAFAIKLLWGLNWRWVSLDMLTLEQRTVCEINWRRPWAYTGQEEFSRNDDRFIVRDSIGPYNWACIPLRRKSVLLKKKIVHRS